MSTVERKLSQQEASELIDAMHQAISEVPSYVEQQAKAFAEEKPGGNWHYCLDCSKFVDADHKC